MSRRAAAGLCWLMLSLLSARVARAQRDSVRVLPEVTIPGARWEARAGFAVQTLDSLALRAQPAANLGEVLAERTPVFVRSYGPGGLATPSFRGTGSSHTQVYWNDVQLNSPLLGQVDLSLLPVALTDEVVIDYGGSSLQHGTGGLGGSLHLRSGPDFGNRLRVALSQAVGRFGSWAANGSAHYGDSRWQSNTRVHYRAAANDFPYFDNVRGQVRELPRAHAAFAQRGVLQEVYHRHGRHTLSGRLWWQNNFRELPAALGAAPVGRPTQADASVRTTLGWAHATPARRLSLSVAYLTDALTYVQDNTAEGLTTARLRSESQTQRVQVNGQGTWFLSDQWYARAGFRLDGSEATSNQFEAPRALRQHEAFGSLTWVPTARWSVSALLRQPYFDGRLRALLPSVGASWEAIPEKLTLRANASRNFRAPTLNDRFWFPVGNPDLQPEEGWQGEAGATGQQRLGRGALRWSLTAYGNRVRNWIIWLPGVSGLWRPENLPDVRTRGVEAFVRGEWGQAGPWALRATLLYTYVRAENRVPKSSFDQSVGRQLLYVPRQQAQVRARLRYGQWALTVAGRAVAERYVLTDGSQTLPPYYLLDAALRRDFRHRQHRLRAEVRAENLNGYHYQSVLGFPMPRRFVSLSLRYFFDDDAA